MTRTERARRARAHNARMEWIADLTTSAILAIACSAFVVSVAAFAFVASHHINGG